jgi:predicted nucleic acid-binding protein
MKLIVDSCVFIDSFDPDSPNHSESLELLELLREKNILITMPAHGWFEVQCTLQRLTNQNRFVGPRIQGVMSYPIELIHIDKEFILKYAMIDIPYTKAADHMFIAVAKVNNYDLITSDGKMYDISKSENINVYRPKEFLANLENNA